MSPKRPQMTAVYFAAGEGSRMKEALVRDGIPSKPLVPLSESETLITRLSRQLDSLVSHHIVIVREGLRDSFEAAFQSTALQGRVEFHIPSEYTFNRYLTEVDSLIPKNDRYV